MSRHREAAAAEETLGMCRLTYNFLDMNEALTSAQSCPTIRVRQNRDALGAEFNWGQLAEAHERWGDRNCRSMQRVRHQGMADVFFPKNKFSSRDNLLAAVVLLIDGKHPRVRN
jgi:hypothetical protein